MPPTDSPSLAAGLAPRYVDVLLLEVMGWDDERVAGCLGIDRDAVPNLRRLAHRKLRELLGASASGWAAGPLEQIGPGVVRRAADADGRHRRR